MNSKKTSVIAPYSEVTTKRAQHTYDSLSKHKVAVIGLGYVGLPLAITVAEKNIPVVGYDIDTKKIEALQKNDVDFLSPEDQAFYKSNPITVDSSNRIIRDADIFFVCVPTPVTEERMPDLAPLIEAARVVGAALRPGNIVLVESTINPGVCDEIVIPILEFESGLTVERDFYFAYCPERVNPGDETFTTKNIPRVVGGAGQDSLERALKIYRAIIDAEILPMNSLAEAEAVKMVENSFRDVNIAFVNELAMAFDLEGIDIVNVIRGASTKPFGFMAHYPGCGVGGHCIPVDPYYLIEHGRRHGFTHHLLMNARAVNNYMPHYTVKLLHQAMYANDYPINKTPIALLGLSYKREVGDLRESPALEIQDLLNQENIDVRAFDPYLPTHSTVDSLEEVLDGAKAIIIATDHDVFRTLAPEFLESRGVQIVIDGRNCLNKQAFEASTITYHGIGRA